MTIPADIRAELGSRDKQIATKPAEVVRKLAHWKRAPDLPAIRDADDLLAEFKRLWADVDALLMRAQGASK